MFVLARNSGPTMKKPTSSGFPLLLKENIFHGAVLLKKVFEKLPIDKIDGRVESFVISPAKGLQHTSHYSIKIFRTQKIQFTRAYCNHVIPKQFPKVVRSLTFYQTCKIGSCGLVNLTTKYLPCIQLPTCTSKEFGQLCLPLTDSILAAWCHNPPTQLL